ncbi:MAG: carbohydrate kinase, partial [Gammaproteobacteria bacterium]|nr:carbohydrate kinase [Gammaproteobacteria bacterium]NIT64800.1 carbohydrate kinase [Gammaproteobacteria bacterium]NIY33380.1 carbohydrate kinase [Gammaproteobacteria bacterium]
QADWLLARLGAPLGVTDENNALKLGFDAARRRWPEWLDGLGVNRELLPRVVPPGTPIGGVGREAQDTLGLGPHTRLVAGTT